MTAPATAAPRGQLAVPVPGGLLLIARRALLVAACLAVVTFIVAVIALGLGDFPLNPGQVIAAIFTDQGFSSTIVVGWRMPRVVAAIVFGLALGASGAVFQTLTRNPLGSPDVIGFSTGAYTGAIIALTVIGGGLLTDTVGALVGGLATALVVYLLAWRGGVQGFRLIIVGIAVTAALASLNTYLLLRAQTEVAMAAAIWGAGSLSLIGWDQVATAAVPLAVLGLLTAVLVRPLRQLELGDDAARAHGVPVNAMRLAMLAVGVGLVAVVTAASGPIAFIALAAPQIARRLTGGAGIPVGAAALTGALLLLLSDVVAQHVVPGSVPVGIVTVVVGGVYLLALLVKEARTHL